MRISKFIIRRIRFPKKYYYGQFKYSNGKEAFMTDCFADKRPLFQLINMLSVGEPIEVVDTTNGESYILN